MSRTFNDITPELAEWIARQRMFFVATAPLSRDGHVNLSPKGGDALRILGPREIAYQDYTGSGAETAAHLRENGRIVMMFCAFEGPPRIVRLHGRGELVTASDGSFADLAARFPAHPGTRAFVRIAVSRVSESCGFGVPLYDFRAARTTLEKSAAAKGAEKLAAYRAAKNRFSIDGLDAFD